LLRRALGKKQPAAFRALEARALQLNRGWAPGRPKPTRLIRPPRVHVRSQSDRVHL